MILYALILYPVLGVALGNTYTAQPTFGLPCPTTIFTFGMLLWIRHGYPGVVLAIPTTWAMVGSSAVRYFGVLDDAMLPVAAVVATMLILWRNRGSRDLSAVGS